MQREARRTLQSLSPAYQEGITEDQYEVLVVENGSRNPLGLDEVKASGSNFFYHFLENPPPSPAYAINYGVSHARGDIVCVMIDGACLVTPAVLSHALRIFRGFSEPVVLTRYFYLGPSIQNDAIDHGYNQQQEDALLASINWPQNGYRLFEIGTPLPCVRDQTPSWFHRTLESNCLFVRKATFERVGGYDERFDIPGGGLVNHDLVIRLLSLTDTTPVQLVGEATFHQIHGGVTTNSSPQRRDARVESYKRQYQQLRGKELAIPCPTKRLHFFGQVRLHAALAMSQTIREGVRQAG
jgi:hypothetical protein